MPTNLQMKNSFQLHLHTKNLEAINCKFPIFFSKRCQILRRHTACSRMMWSFLPPIFFHLFWCAMANLREPAIWIEIRQAIKRYSKLKQNLSVVPKISIYTSNNQCQSFSEKMMHLASYRGVRVRGRGGRCRNFKGYQCPRCVCIFQDNFSFSFSLGNLFGPFSKTNPSFRLPWKACGQIKILNLPGIETKRMGPN